MSIAIYGGSFDPPHLGHLNVVKAVRESFELSEFLVIPAGLAPHKMKAADGAGDAARLEMCRLAFGDYAVVSDLEMKREGKSYTADTVQEVKGLYPDEDMILVMGTDMFLSLDTWHDAEYILRSVRVCVVQRDDERAALVKKAEEYLHLYGTATELLNTEPLELSSTEIRAALKKRGGTEMLDAGVYEYIIAHCLYGAKPDWAWLRDRAYAMLKPNRIPHVAGCELEAVKLARRWGADEELAAEAAILHDITKRLGLNEQLLLCVKYGIIPDTLEAKSEKLLHSKTGSAVAEERFGVCREVAESIRWHTTGKADMTLLEKIIYLADYIEPTRDFEGVEALRKLCYEDIDKALVLGFEMSIEDLRSYGVPPHKNTLEALDRCRRDGEK